MLEKHPPVEREQQAVNKLLMQYMQAWQQLPRESYREQVVPDDKDTHESWPNIVGSKARMFSTNREGNPSVAVALIFWSEGGDKVGAETHRFGVLIQEPDRTSDEAKKSETGENLVATLYSFRDDGGISVEEEVSFPSSPGSDFHDFKKHDRDVNPGDVARLNELHAKINLGDISTPRQYENGSYEDIMNSWGPYHDAWVGVEK